MLLATYRHLIEFLKNPNCEPFVSEDNKFEVLIRLLYLLLISAFTLGILIGILSHTGLFDLETHKLEQLFGEKPKLIIFLLAVIVAPVSEELIFRAPIPFFCNHKQFKYIFYGIALLFGFVHISNYELSTTILIFSPLLISPQIVAGLILGYTRVKLGLHYSIVLHMVFNGILISPSLLFSDII